MGTENGVQATGGTFGVFAIGMVQAAVPNTTAKTITLFLNKALTASYPVTWIVIERP